MFNDLEWSSLLCACRIRNKLNMKTLTIFIIDVLTDRNGTPILPITRSTAHWWPEFIIHFARALAHAINHRHPEHIRCERSCGVLASIAQHRLLVTFISSFVFFLFHCCYRAICLTKWFIVWEISIYICRYLVPIIMINIKVSSSSFCLYLPQCVFAF